METEGVALCFKVRAAFYQLYSPKSRANQRLPRVTPQAALIGQGLSRDGRLLPPGGRLGRYAPSNATTCGRLKPQAETKRPCRHWRSLCRREKASFLEAFVACKPQRSSLLGWSAGPSLERWLQLDKVESPRRECGGRKVRILEYGLLG